MAKFTIGITNGMLSRPAHRSGPQPEAASARFRTAADREVDFRTDENGLDWETSRVDFRNADSQGGFFVYHTTRYVIGCETQNHQEPL